MPQTPVGRGAHPDALLTSLAIKAFSGTGEFIAQQVFPVVPVGKQNDRYNTLDKDSWLRIVDTRRAPKTLANRIEFKTSTDGYFADNYALAGENSFEDLDNADSPIALRQNTTDVVIEGLARDLEVRVANQVTSLTNLGSGTTLTGAAKWSDYAGSDPISDVNTAHAFIRNNTGLKANTAIVDEDTMIILRRHPAILDMFKYTSGGQLTDEQLMQVFGVQRLLVGGGIKNMAKEGATASIVNIWGNNFILARIVPATGLKTATFGLGFRWRPAGTAAPMQVFRYNHPHPGARLELIEAQYYQDEKIVAADLAYGIAGTL